MALLEQDDIVQTALNPPEAYKTSVLSGLSPQLILDIATRAMHFWQYQKQQEAAFQAYITRDAQEVSLVDRKRKWDTDACDIL